MPWGRPLANSLGRHGLSCYIVRGQLMSWWAHYKLWFNVIETGGSWFVERDGRTVALLTDPHFVDMFWYAWHLEPLVEDSSDRAKIMSNEYWNDESLQRTVFRSREYGTI